MAIGLIGRKCGMTRVFTDDGVSVPVTVVEVAPNRVTGYKDQQRDGYTAIQMTSGVRRASRISKPVAGYFAKLGVEAGRVMREFRLDASESEAYAGKRELDVELFTAGQKVDVSGTTIGKGYAGTVKRHNFATKDASHGNSLSHRTPGSIGQNQTPGRVFKGKRMSGHMGNVRRTVKNLEVVRVDAARNLLLIRGAIPGATGGDVIIRPGRKTKD